MSRTSLEDINEQIQKFWSPIFTKELREDTLLIGLVDKTYQGEMKRMGDTVYVSQVNAPQGQLLTIDKDDEANHDADSFSSEKVSTSRIGIVANRRAVASYEMEDLVELQSQIQSESSDIREALRFAVEKQINDDLYNRVAPSAAAPVHDVTGVTDFDASQLLATRKLASSAKWRRDQAWWLLAGPQYMNDLLSAQTLTSSDFVGDDKPTIAGQIINKRYNFNIVEDNSRADDYALAFTPDWLHLAMQREVQFKVSDLHSNKQFGFVISVDVVYGAALGIDGDLKHIRITN